MLIEILFTVLTVLTVLTIFLIVFYKVHRNSFSDVENVRHARPVGRGVRHPPTAIVSRRQSPPTRTSLLRRKI